jgi:hypothetical protein
LSVQFSGLVAALGGEAYRDLGPGYGGEAQGRFTLSAFSIGGGWQYTRHRFAQGPDLYRIGVSGPFLEPRYVILIGRRDMAPYVSARLSLLRQHYEKAGFEGSSIGTTINGGGGLLVRLAGRINLDVGATYGRTQFKHFTIRDLETTELTEVPVGPGSNLVMRVGVGIGLGW